MNLPTPMLMKTVQRLAKVGAPGLVNFITAVAYHFCPSLPTAFTQPGASTLANRVKCVVGAAASLVLTYERGTSLRNSYFAILLPLSDCLFGQCGGDDAAGGGRRRSSQNKER